MADMHHLRFEREAVVKNDAAIRQQAKDLKKAEHAMIEAADSVIVHSSFERSLIKTFDPAANVHAIPWTVRRADANAVPPAFGDCVYRWL